MTRGIALLPDGRYVALPTALLLPRATVKLVTDRLGSPGSLLPKELAVALYRFPDGSVLVRGDVADGGAVESFERTLRESDLATDIVFNAGLRQLGGFGAPRNYRLLYLRSYKERIGSKAMFLVYPVPPWTDPSPGEYRLEEVPVTVRFRTRISTAYARAFAGVVRSWGDVVGKTGVFGEGPALVLDDRLEFQGQHCRFRLDLSGSGQETVNWLTLLILEFGFEVHPVERVRYDMQDRANLDQIMGVPRGKVIAVALSSLPATPSTRAETTGIGPETASFVPSLAVAHPTYQSVRFRVLQSSRCSWDDFVLTVYFSAWPDPQLQQAFREMIMAWFTIGRYGGLGGGNWGKLHSDVKFDEASESARVSADLTGTEEAIAIPLLVKILEGFSEYTPIEAMTIGGLADLTDWELESL